MTQLERLLKFVALQMIATIDKDFLIRAINASNTYV